jgi:CRISPR-associated exonuclease Cas4
LALKKSSSSPLSKSWTPEEWTIIVFAVVAMLLAINGLTVKQRVMIAMMDLIGRMLLGFAILWLLTGFIIFYISLKGGIISRGIERELNQLLTEATDRDAISINQKLQQLEQREQAEATRGTLWFAIVAIALALNSIMIRMGPHLLLGHIFEIIALVWLIGACFFLYDALKNSALAKKLRTIHKIIAGEIKYVDKLSAATPILITAKYGIRGRPDYIIEREGRYVPVEIKIGRIPKGPYFSHILQIAAYCLLVEEQYRTVPPYGVIKYTEDSKTKECKIEYTPELKSLLLEKISAMRVAIRTQDVHRNHRRIGKCKNCSRRLACKERLV